MVVSSKNEGEIFLIIFILLEINFLIKSLSIFLPFIVILSLKSFICGEVNKPTFRLL